MFDDDVAVIVLAVPALLTAGLGQRLRDTGVHHNDDDRSNDLSVSNLVGDAHDDAGPTGTTTTHATELPSTASPSSCRPDSSSRSRNDLLGVDDGEEEKTIDQIVDIIRRISQGHWFPPAITEQPQHRAIFYLRKDPDAFERLYNRLSSLDLQDYFDKLRVRWEAKTGFLCFDIKPWTEFQSGIIDNAFNYFLREPQSMKRPSLSEVAYSGTDEEGGVAWKMAQHWMLHTNTVNVVLLLDIPATSLKERLNPGFCHVGYVTLLLRRSVLPQQQESIEKKMMAVNTNHHLVHPDYAVFRDSKGNALQGQVEIPLDVFLPASKRSDATGQSKLTLPFKLLATWLRRAKIAERYVVQKEEKQRQI
ncbi:hypothetical protein F5Y16DRAFT_421523 [Xylariaceae sp. FL0255]|nr:hypothetical protein F5Y16DRAFT_421523 [Xylariaceae sp. FL0255]